jgi:hypothetical protein
MRRSISIVLAMATMTAAVAFGELGAGDFARR